MLYNYLSDVIADYTTTELSVCPTAGMTVSGDKNIMIHKGLGVAEERVSLNNATRFSVTLTWQNMTETDHETLFDFYHDNSKACGMLKSFYWVPPSNFSTYSYTVRFGIAWESFLRIRHVYGISRMVLVVLGRKPVA